MKMSTDCRKNTIKLRTLTKVVIGICLLGSSFLLADEKVRVEKDGIIHVSAFDLPESAYLSEETRVALKRFRDIFRKDYDEAFVSKQCPSSEGAAVTDMPAIRQCLAQAFYQTSLYKSITDRYDVTLAQKRIGGVYTEIFTPAEGVAPKNKNRVLINLHGGGLFLGSRTISHIESMPIASVGKIKVISVDYRMGPEYQFPAASEDVARVYRELLKEYKPENIGLYGCSGGGTLTAQSIAWFQNEELPLPGAVGMFCSAAPVALDNKRSKAVRSDGAYIGGAIAGINLESLSDKNPYFRRADFTIPLVSPGSYDDIMANFPPSLLISGSRDFALSNVVYTHTQLTRLGVEADLHIWEGLDHGFHYWPELPESREAHDVIANFFDKHLGR